MISLSLKTIAQEIDGELVGDGSITVSGVETDSRKNVEGILFVALKGERFDAHEFIKDVEGRKAAAVVTEHRCDVSIPQIIVKDTLKALGKIGLLNRKSCRAKVVSVTGTCGKTSVKEMTSSILKQVGNTVATRGNFNNNIGVPISLLQINENTDFAVIELGANHPHEIEYIVNLVEATRQSELFSMGASPRGTIAMLRMAKAMAVIEGRDYVTAGDVQAVTRETLGHRVKLGQRTRAQGINMDGALRLLLESVPAPRI